MSDKWIMQVPVLSTAHLTQEAMNELLLAKPSRSYYGMQAAEYVGESQEFEDEEEVEEGVVA